MSTRARGSKLQPLGQIQSISVLINEVLLEDRHSHVHAIYGSLHATKACDGGHMTHKTKTIFSVVQSFSTSHCCYLGLENSLSEKGYPVHTVENIMA
jgi:hypothetical protein